MHQPNDIGPITHLPLSTHIRSPAIDLVITVLTCFLFSLFVQYKQMQAVNDLLGMPKYSWIKWFLLSFITCGIYHIYHEYIVAMDLAQITGQDESVVTLVLGILGLPFVADAIQQAQINRYLGSEGL
jgi:uncharacterized membrane protein